MLLPSTETSHQVDIPENKSSETFTNIDVSSTETFTRVDIPSNEPSETFTPVDFPSMENVEPIKTVAIQSTEQIKEPIKSVTEQIEEPIKSVDIQNIDEETVTDKPLENPAISTESFTSVDVNSSEQLEQELSKTEAVTEETFEKEDGGL